MKFFKRENLSTKLFVTSSIGALVVFWFCAAFLVLFLFGTDSRNADDDKKKEVKKQSSEVKDPFIRRNPNLELDITEPILDSSDPSIGNKDATVTIVEYSDFECSFCAEQEKNVRQLIREKYKDKVKLAWKDYPTADKSASSFKASRAARCADEQGEFWSYHDKLFEAEREMNKGLFIDIANELDLNLDNFLSCYKEGKVDDKIMSNIKEADELGLPGVPFFYVNDQEILGSIEKENLEKIIKVELNN